MGDAPVNDVSYAAALVLAAVFAWAGVAKLRAGTSTTITFTTLGLPAAGALATVVPLAELALAAGLVLVPGWAAVVALPVLAGFTAYLARAVRAGTVVSCGCFGSARHTPVSAVELVRNGFLALAALVAVGATRPLVPGLAAVVAVGTAVVIAMVVLALADLKRRAGHVWAMELPRR